MEAGKAYDNTTPVWTDQQYYALKERLVDGLHERERLCATIESLQMQLHQAMGALGYPVPGDVPEGDFKCGLCEAKMKRVTEAEAHRYALYQVIKIMSESRK